MRTVMCVLAAATVIATSKAAAQQAPPIDVAALGLTVTNLQRADSIITRHGVVRAMPGTHLVVATLTGEAPNNGWLLASPTHFNARITITGNGPVAHRIVPARGFAVRAAGERSSDNWIVQPSGVSEVPILHATVRRGDVRILLLYEVPSSVTALHVMIPSIAAGQSLISTP